MTESSEPAPRRSAFTYHMPDKLTLQAIGRVAIVHGRLHDALAMTVKSVAEVTPDEARNACEGARFVDMASRVRRLALERLGDGQALVKLDSVLQRARAANKGRNDLLHSLWAAPLDNGEPVTRGEGEWGPPPTVPDLQALEAKMAQLVNEIHGARLTGWLRDAVAEAKAKALKK